jgi:hypothetical protein
VSAAKKRVKEWVAEGRRLAGLPEDDADTKAEEEIMDCDAVDSSVLEIATKVL